MPQINADKFNNALEVQVTADSVIKKRQAEIMDDVFVIDTEIASMQRELDAMKLKRAERMMEHDMWERYDQRNIIVTTTTTTIQVTGRMNPVDKMKFDDALKEVMMDAGRPISLADIVARLARYSFRWNNHASAQNHIVRSGLVERLDAEGRRVYYQLMKRT